MKENIKSLKISFEGDRYVDSSPKDLKIICDELKDFKGVNSLSLS